MKDPVAAFAIDRARARELDDTLVDRCFLATVDAHGEPHVRTLVLRDVDDNLALFCNASSPKVAELQNSKTVAIVAYWPTIQVQYRMNVRVRKMDPAIVARHWRLKPTTTKKLDALYEHTPQSTEIKDREALIAAVSEAEIPKIASSNSIGFLLHPVRIERLDLNTSEGIHDRRLYSLRNQLWAVSTLLP